MKIFVVLMLVTFVSFLLITPALAINADDLPKYSKVYDEKSDPFKDANAAIKLAQKTQRNVLIEIGGNLCSWCKKWMFFWPKTLRFIRSSIVSLSC
ncbi:MAG: thioredoxin-related protein [Colwellia sp.]|jgi:thioredoxin-related protein